MANDITELMLSDQFNDFDLDDYMTEGEQAANYGELLAEIALYKYDHELTANENRVERLARIMEKAEADLDYYVNRKQSLEIGIDHSHEKHVDDLIKARKEAA